MKAQSRVDFETINRAALARLQDLCARWLPDGRRRGHEYVARNPRRADRRAGSFSMTLNSGRWADFAIGARGGDPVSLAAYLSGLGQADAARRLCRSPGLAPSSRWSSAMPPFDSSSPTARTSVRHDSQNVVGKGAPAVS